MGRTSQPTPNPTTTQPAMLAPIQQVAQFGTLATHRVSRSSVVSGFRSADSHIAQDAFSTTAWREPLAPGPWSVHTDDRLPAVGGNGATHQAPLGCLLRP